MILSFLDFELDLDVYELRRAGDRIPVEPQVFDVLTHLAANRGRVVPKVELLDAVWGDRFVSDSALSSRIKTARRAVDDDGRRQRVIATAHGRGFRFVPEVREVTRPLGDPSPPSGRRPDLLERDDVLDQIVAAVVAARSRSGRLLCIGAEAGGGKTSLVEQARASVGADVPVLMAGCDDLTTPRALGPIRDLIEELPPESRDALADDVDGGGLLRAFELLAGDGGAVLVVIEDLHWADDATLDVVRQLVHRVRSVPVVLVITFRDEEVTLAHPLQRLLGSVQGPHVSRLSLPPLSAAAVAALAAGTPHDAVGVLRATGGNPLFVSEVLAAPPGTLPRTISDAVLGRLAQLPDPEVDGVRRLSVLPVRVERDLVVALGVSGETGLTGAERLGILTGDATHVWFRHELVRRAVEASLSPTELVRHNRDVALLLQARGADPARLAHHARQGGEVELLISAGTRAAANASKAGAQRQAVEHLDAVLVHGDRLAPRQRADLLTQRAHALYLLNRFGAGIEAARAAVAAAEEVGDDERLAVALITLGRTALWAIGPRAACQAVERAIEVLGPTGDLELRSTAHADLARAKGELVTIGSVAQGNPSALDSAAEAVHLANLVQRADLRAYALMYQGSERLALGDAGGLTDLEEAVAVLSAYPRADFAVRALVNVSGACYRTGRFGAAERYVELGLGLARGAEFFSGQYRLQLTRAATRASQGRWRDAEDELRALLASEGEPGIMEPLARTLLARLLARTGRHDEASEVLHPALTQAVRTEEMRLAGPVAVAAVEVAWIAGTAPDALDLATQVLDLAGDGRAVRAELLRYLQLAGLAVPAPAEADHPEPWASGLRGDWRAAAGQWERRGETYEQAIELLSGDDPTAAAQGEKLLRTLGASGTIAVLSAGTP